MSDALMLAVVAFGGGVAAMCMAIVCQRDLRRLERQLNALRAATVSQISSRAKWVSSKIDDDDEARLLAELDRRAKEKHGL